MAASSTAAVAAEVELSTPTCLALPILAPFLKKTALYSILVHLVTYFSFVSVLFFLVLDVF